ncbi:MAG: Rieske 2Fe-2S domain-containing protein [Desulfovermiculus sp.]|nr:Rieske 2Fe-2S domain-containing protein [Desulfovermiculus sp.]
MTRQRFLKWLLRSTAGGALLAVGGWPIVRFMTWQERGVRMVDFAAHEQRPFQTKDGAILVPKDDSLQALSTRCTHLGCRVEFDQTRNELICPCHKSAYDVQGNRLRGPARSDLPVLQIVKLESGALQVTVPIKG